MRIKPRQDRPIIAAQRKRNQDLEQVANSLGLGWRVVSATIFHRYPVIMKEPEPWEVAMQKVQAKIHEKQRAAFMDLVGDTEAQFVASDNPVSPYDLL